MVPIVVEGKVSRPRLEDAAPAGARDESECSADELTACELRRPSLAVARAPVAVPRDERDVRATQARLRRPTGHRYRARLIGWHLALRVRLAGSTRERAAHLSTTCVRSRYRLRDAPLMRYNGVTDWTGSNLSCSVRFAIAVLAILTVGCGATERPSHRTVRVKDSVARSLRRRT